MFCSRCGQRVPDADAFCAFCGNPLVQGKIASAHLLLGRGVTGEERHLHARREALVSLVLALLCWILSAGGFLTGSGPVLIVAPIVGVFAVILGHSSRHRIRQIGGKTFCYRVATAGMLLAYLGVLAWIAMPKVSDWNSFPSWEAKAVGSLRSINGAAAKYAATYHHGFPPSLSVMGPPAPRFVFLNGPPSERSAGFIDKNLAAGADSHYRYTYIPGAVDAAGNITMYSVRADQLASCPFTLEHYFTDESGVIREDTKEANRGSPQLPSP